jgi:hypothetical protein
MRLSRFIFSENKSDCSQEDGCGFSGSPANAYKIPGAKAAGDSIRAAT